MIKKSCIKFVGLMALLTFQACDDGLIPEKTYTSEHSGYTAKLTAHVSGVDSWPEYYDVALAAFDNSSEYSRSQTTVHPDSSGNVTLLLYNIGTDIQTVEFCVTNTLRRRVLTFASTDLSNAVGDTIYLDAGEVDASMYSAIQENIFNRNCSSCHGASTSPAAGLYLTEGLSYASLVNQPSTTTPDSIRVIPGNSTWSILHQVLQSTDELNLSYYHGNILTTIETRLIDEWIDAGASY